jgi:uncharacterized protein with PhoU and TrkA domain
MTNLFRECQCVSCLADKGSEKWTVHHQMNVLLSRLDEQQRRWYVALESKKIGHGGDQALSVITGMDVETIRRGRRELDQDLSTRPVDRVREAGGGQPAVEKKTRRSRRH